MTIIPQLVENNRHSTKPGIPGGTLDPQAADEGISTPLGITMHQVVRVSRSGSWHLTETDPIHQTLCRLRARGNPTVKPENQRFQGHSITDAFGQNIEILC